MQLTRRLSQFVIFKKATSISQFQAFYKNSDFTVKSKLKISTIFNIDNDRSRSNL